MLLYSYVLAGCLAEKLLHMSRYGLLEAKNAGESVEEDIGFDGNGAVSRDPAAILDGGAIRNFSRSGSCSPKRFWVCMG